MLPFLREHKLENSSNFLTYALALEKTSTKEDSMSTKTPNGLDKLGLKDIGDVYYNLSYDELQAHETNNGECNVSTTGTAMVDTGIFTGRSPKDK